MKHGLAFIITAPGKNNCSWPQGKRWTPDLVLLSHFHGKLWMLAKDLCTWGLRAELRIKPCLLPLCSLVCVPSVP